MSHNRGWHGRRHYNQNQDDRYYGPHDSSYHGHDSSYARSNGYCYPDVQPSHSRFNYWRDDPYYAPNQYQPSSDYSRSHGHADDYHLAEGSYSRQQGRRSNSPNRQYHTRAERADIPTPYITPPSFRRRTPDTAPLPTSQKMSQTLPPPAEPNSAYVALSLEPSHIVDDPRASRKLLILDLNGTLLIRSQHNSRTRQQATRDAGHAPRLRAVQLRPYIPAFRAYLFAPETQEWLDTMVWSSAQPHSVADMVDKVFGDSKSKLVAVWDRDSLGLSKLDYCRKAQTTKDLTKPWTLLQLATSSAENAVRSEVDGITEQTGLAPSVTHSAMTTLLLDDSPAKARLQPYNHVCIPEYDSSLRGTDLRRYEREKIEAKSILAMLPIPPTDNELPEEGSKADMHALRKREVHAQSVSGQTGSADISISSSDPELGVVGSTSVPVEQSSISILSAERVRPAETYDPTLLAVIGILDEIKRQSNVAGWIRSGGLLDITAAVPEVEGEPQSATTSPYARVIEDSASPADPRAAKRLARKARRAAEKQRKREENSAWHATKAVFSANQEVTQTGNGESSIPTGNLFPDACAENARMWFNEEDMLTYWVGRGRSALENLGIQAAHGITG